MEILQNTTVFTVKIVSKSSTCAEDNAAEVEGISSIDEVSFTRPHARDLGKQSYMNMLGYQPGQTPHARLLKSYLYIYIYIYIYI